MMSHNGEAQLAEKYLEPVPVIYFFFLVNETRSSPHHRKHKILGSVTKWSLGSIHWYLSPVALPNLVVSLSLYFVSVRTKN